MRKIDRLFEIIQILRANPRALTAEQLADRLEVSVRTIYRDIQGLQAMRIPVEGEAGVGYIIRNDYDMPALNFTPVETEAIVLGLNMLARSGDTELRKAAESVSTKLDAVYQRIDSLQSTQWGAALPDATALPQIRSAIRNERKLSIRYLDLKEQSTNRTILPIALIYYIEVVILVAWCELRTAYRHFRVDRILACEMLDANFTGKGNSLRIDWQREEAAGSGRERVPEL